MGRITEAMPEAFGRSEVRFQANAAYADGVRHEMYESGFTLTNDRLMVQSLRKGRLVTVNIPEITSVTIVKWSGGKDIRIEMAPRATVDAMFKRREQAEWFLRLLYEVMQGGLPYGVPPMP